MRLITRLETPAEITNQLETRGHQLETRGHPSKKKANGSPTACTTVFTPLYNFTSLVRQLTILEKGLLHDLEAS